MHLYMKDIKKLYTFGIIIFPILSVYSAMGNITAAEIFILIICIICLPFFEFKKVRQVFPLLYASAYIIIQMAIYQLLNIQALQYRTVATIHLLTKYILVAVFTRNSFDIEWGMWFYKKMAVLSSVFMIIQVFLVETAGVYLSGVLPGFTYMRESLYTLGSYAGNASFRCYSFFAEPSEFSVYVALALAVGLYEKKVTDNFKSYIPEALITISLLLSMSNTGILLGILIWSMFIADRVRKSPKINKKKMIVILILLAAFIVAVPYIYNSKYFQTFLLRTFGEAGSKHSLGGSAQGRFNGYGELLNDFQGNLWYWIFGIGESIFHTDIWYLPGDGNILKQFGVIGCLFVLYTGLRNRSNKYSRLIFLLLLLIGIGSDAYITVFSVVYLSFFFAEEKDRRLING